MPPINNPASLTAILSDGYFGKGRNDTAILRLVATMTLNCHLESACSELCPLAQLSSSPNFSWTRTFRLKLSTQRSATQLQYAGDNVLPFLIRTISTSASAIMKGRKQLKRHRDHTRLWNCSELVNSGVFSVFRAPLSYKGYRLLLSPEFPAPNIYWPDKLSSRREESQ